MKICAEFAKEEAEELTEEHDRVRDLSCPACWPPELVES